MPADYTPHPIDTSDVELSPELEELVERLSESNHDNWARQRIRDGWVHGGQRDDDRKTHPGLVPYDELPDGEKAYDRISVVETVKAMIALGYEVRRRDE